MSTIKVLFEDTDFLFAFKDAGIPVHSTYDKKRPDFFSNLCKQLDRSPENPDKYLALHNRIDVETSGVVAFAKSNLGNETLRLLFQERKIKKTYWALTEAKPTKKSEWTIENHLDERNKKMSVVRSGGQKAITQFRILKKLSSCHLIEACPLTGRKHQIRTHLETSRLPILGDSLYGAKAKAERVMLHAKSLEFIHPKTGQPFSVEAPIPADFLEYMAEVPIS